jgi:hypothetical protein
VLPALWTAVLLVTGTLLALTVTPALAHAAPATADRSAAAAAANTAVTTFKNDVERDGDFSSETILNESNVNVSQFGKRVQYPVDGQVYAEPLFLPGLTVGGAAHNVAFVATENDSVYAFDADATSAIAPLWKVSLLPGGATAVSSNVSGCGDLTPEIGITGTPVIDPATGTLFVVSYDSEGGNEVYRLHALNAATGADKWPPIVISGSVPGTGVGSSGGNVAFNPVTNRQRPNLLLENGKVYVGFSSFCDIGAYHGWIMSYSYSTTAFTLANVYADTPNGSDGGIWSGSGGAVAGDPSGNVYYQSGNGTFDASTGGPDYGDSFVKLNGSLQVQDYFTPYNQLCLSQGDVDLGAGGPLVIPSAGVVISAGKEGRPYVVSTTSMGKYTADPNLVCGGTDSTSTTIDKVQQELPPGTVGSLFSTPALWTSSTGAQDVYFTQSNGPTRAFTFSGGKLSGAATSSSSGNGGDPVVSSNGTTAGTGIVWDQDYGGELHALNPANLAVEYWNSGMNSSRDGLPGEVKYATPAVANGEVLVGLPAGLAIFGLLGTSPPPPPPAPTGLAATAGNASVALAWTASPGATSYNIYRGTTSGGEGSTPAATTASTSYTDTGLTNGTTYYYKVSAANGGGTSAQSSEVSAKPSGSSPTSVQISAGGPATGTWAADEDFAGGGTSATANAISTTGVTSPAPQSVYQHNRGVLDDGGLADLQRLHRRDAGADQLRHLRHRWRRVQGGGGAVQRGRSEQRDVHHPVRHGQGQRPGQRHRDPVVLDPGATPGAHRPRRDRRQRLGDSVLERQLGCHQLQHLPQHHVRRRRHYGGWHIHVGQLHRHRTGQWHHVLLQSQREQQCRHVGAVRRGDRDADVVVAAAAVQPADQRRWSRERDLAGR